MHIYIYIYIHLRPLFCSGDARPGHHRARRRHRVGGQGPAATEGASFRGS